MNTTIVFYAREGLIYVQYLVVVLLGIFNHKEAYKDPYIISGVLFVWLLTGCVWFINKMVPDVKERKGLVETKIWGLPVGFFIMLGVSAMMFVFHYAPKMLNIDSGNDTAAGESQTLII